MTKSENSKYLFYFFFILFCLISKIISQKITPISIGQIVRGNMQLDESHKYYSLTIPKNESNRLLIITTHEDNSDGVGTKSSFSDPDFYISKKNKYPSSKRSSEWFSEQYGADILSIPSESVGENDIFYIGIYCQYKCKYYLKIVTGIETEIQLNKYNFLRLKSHETMNYKFKVKDDFQKLKVMTYSMNSGNFKVFMNQNAPSSINTYRVIPSWDNGYVIIIKNDTKEYCTNCEYHIIIHNEENEGKGEINEIILYVATEEKNSEFNLNNFKILYDALDINSKACFNFNITDTQKKNEKLILDISVFSGEATLLIEGWKPKNIPRKKLAELYEYSYKIVMEKHIILDKKDFDVFDKEENYNNRDSVLHLCLYNIRQISYTFQAYFLTSFEKIGHVGILASGNKIRGYLLKDQVINYQLLVDYFSKSKYNIETNLTITSNKIIGNTTLYTYFCKEEICNLTTKNDIEKLDKNNELIKTQKTQDPYVSLIEISSSNNYCMKNARKKTEKGNIIDCLIYAIIKCDSPGEENGLCIFDIKLTVEDSELVMKPKQVYHSMLPIGKVDKYRIIVSDENIKDIFVVLNSESGDAQLHVYKEKETSYNKESLITISSHKDYIPDVVRITPKKVGQDNLVGKYIIKVIPETFSTYKIYYYAIYKNQKKMPEVIMNLNMGQLLSDYFPNDIRYKIYSFTPLYDKKSNIKIFINRVNINFDIFVYNDISKFEIAQLFELRRNPNIEPIKGYQWKSNANNEVIISKNDTNYTLNKLLYIVVAPSDPFFSIFENNDIKIGNGTNSTQKLLSQFYIGIISEQVPISLSEGVPHVMTLSNTYSVQMYHRIQSNVKKNLEIELNVLLGEIDIFASYEYFKEEDIKNIDIKSATYNTQTETYEIKNFIFKLNLKSFSILKISSDFMTTNMGTNNSKYPVGHIYYYIRRSNSMISHNKICQYALVEKTTETRGQLLQPGLVHNGNLKVGRKAYFIIEEIEKRKSAYINVIFKRGSGNVYLRIPTAQEAHNRLRFPDEGNNDYKGVSIYSGRMINIPEKEFDKLGSQGNYKLQLLITITADTGSFENNEDNPPDNTNNNQNIEAEYSIYYSSEPKRLNQNVPFNGFISQGEFQYFNLYFDKNTENIYIGLTNMNGDADIYLNKGSQLPTLEKYDWNSANPTHEYIDINKNDQYFKDNKKSISGYYTLLLVGFVDTSYSLFVSNHKNKVFPLNDNQPITCICKKSGEKCLFRYSDVYDKNNVENGINHNEIIFTTQYLYGSGTMYAKTYDDKEIHDCDEFYKNFPDKNNYDYSNKESNQRNYIKMKISGEKYNKDSNILLTFECNEKTKVDVTSTSLQHFSSVSYIDENRENIFYLGVNDKNNKQSQLTLILSNSDRDQDLIYSVHSYTGDAHIKVYGNSTIWDPNTQKEGYNYKLMKEFDIITKNKDQDNNIEIYNPYTHDYHNYISKKEKDAYDNIYFYILPKTEFGFYIQCNFDKNWKKILIEKSQDFYVVNQEFYGYFDISDEYEDVEFSLSIEKNLKLFADVYMKINVIDKDKITQIKKSEEKKNDEFSFYHYSLPTTDNYDYRATTDKTLGKLSLDINNLPKLSEQDLMKGNKIIRALFFVQLGTLNFEPVIEDNNENSNNGDDNDSKEDDKDFSKTMINIVITPRIGNIKYIDIKPYEYYFSNLTYNTTLKRTRHVENKVYFLTCENPHHDVLVIEISSCEGQYDLNIREELVTKNNIEGNGIKYIESNINGKKVIYVEKIKSKHYYLTIKSKRSKFICNMLKIKDEECGNDLSYLIYYYTTFSDNISFQDIDKWIIHQPYGLGKIKLELPLIITNDIELNRKDIKDYKFDVFATKNKDYTSKMGSICYLSRLIPNENKIFKLENLIVSNKSSLILQNLVPRQTYYINVLVQNIRTKEMITFRPIEVFSGGKSPYFWRFINFIIVFGLIVFLLYYIYKYKKAQDELIFIKGDALPRSETEMSGYGYESKTVKYSGLGSGY